MLYSKKCYHLIDNGSAKSIYNMKRDALKHKALILNEAFTFQGNSSSDSEFSHIVRCLLSEGSVRYQYTGYDDDGNKIAKYQTVYGPTLSITFTDLDLFKQLPLLKKRIKTSKRLFELIEKTADCSLRMVFPFVLFENGNYKEYHFENKNCSSSLFRFKILSSEKASNGNILSREYKIAFDTILGFFFMQNVLSCHTSLLPGHFYNMSEYAQLFYRMLILPYFNGKKIPISLKEIKARLVLKSDNSMSRKTVKKILKELESNRLISNPDEVQKKDGSYWYQYKKNDWKTITNKIEPLYFI